MKMKQLNLELLKYKGIFFKTVDCIDTVGINISTMVGQIVNGVLVGTTTRMLTTAQINGVNNGIYINGARSEDFETGDNAYGTLIYDANTNEFLYSTAGIIGTNNLTFTKIQNGGDVESFNGRTGMVVPQNNDYTITQIQNNSVLANSNNINIINPQDENILTYRSGTWQNIAYYGTYTSTADIVNTSVTPAYNTIYFSNLGTFNMPNSIKGASIKIVNIGGTLCTINFSSKILWHITNLFNVTLTTNEAAEIEFIGLGGNSWQLKNMTGKWNNSLNSDKLTISGVKFSDLSDVFVPGVANGKILRYNGGLFYWNATDETIMSVFGRTGNIIGATGDYDIAQIGRISLSSPINGQLLRYNGFNFVNSAETINSVFGRTGAVVPQNNDYAITQIQNSSVLANSANINIVGPQFNNFLYYNGAQWANTEISAYIGRFQPSVNTTMQLQNIYASGVNNQSFTVPTCGAGDVGRRILLTAASLNQTTLVVPTGIFLNSSTNFTSSSSLGSIEIVVSGSNQYQIIAVYGNWLNNVNLRKFAPTELSSLYDCTITSPQVGNVLSYNGTNWINSNTASSSNYISGNSAGALSSGQFFRLNGSGQDGNEFRCGFLSPINMTITAIYGFLSTAPGGTNSRTFRLRVNGVDTALQVTISGNSISGNSAASVNVVAGDRITVRHTSSGAMGSEGMMSLRVN